MKYLIVIMFVGLCLWLIILIGTLQQDLKIAQEEISTHWHLVKTYHSQIDAWADYQKALDEGRNVTWKVIKKK